MRNLASIEGGIGYYWGALYRGSETRITTANLWTGRYLGGFATVSASYKLKNTKGFISIFRFEFVNKDSWIINL